MPELPVSLPALMLTLNMMTLWFLAPAVFRPVWGGWYRQFVVVCFSVNLAVTCMNFWTWLHL